MRAVEPLALPLWSIVGVLTATRRRLCGDAGTTGSSILSEKKAYTVQYRIQRRTTHATRSQGSETRIWSIVEALNSHDTCPSTSSPPLQAAPANHKAWINLILRNTTRTKSCQGRLGQESYMKRRLPRAHPSVARLKPPRALIWQPPRGGNDDYHNENSWISGWLPR